MSTDLADNATHQEIQEYVNQVVADVEKDRAGEQSEEKTDSQQLAEDNDTPVVPETDSGDDTPAETGEETGPEDQAEDWLDDDLKAEIAAYGIDEKELADFTSRDELERALRFLDRSALEVGRKALAEGGKDETQETEPARNEQGKFTKSEPKEGTFEVSLDKDVYDEGLVEELTRMRDHYESRLDAFESRFAEADARAEEQRFDSLVDSLGHADLFGVTGKESAKHLERRQDLHVAVKAQQIGLEMLGRGVDLDQLLVNRVARMVFADELGKKELKARTRKVSKQSDGRMGGSATKAQDQKEPLMEEMERLYKELENA